MSLDWNRNTFSTWKLILQVPGLEDYLKHEINCYYPISYLPTVMRQQLMHERKYIFAFNEVCTSLCLAGLLSFGRREWKDKQQVRHHNNFNLNELRSVVFSYYSANMILFHNM